MLPNLYETQPEMMKKCDFVLSQVKKMSKQNTDEKFFNELHFKKSDLYSLNKKGTENKL